MSRPSPSRGRAMLTTVASSDTMPEPSTVPRAPTGRRPDVNRSPSPPGLGRRHPARSSPAAVAVAMARLRGWWRRRVPGGAVARQSGLGQEPAGGAVAAVRAGPPQHRPARRPTGGGLVDHVRGHHHVAHAAMAAAGEAHTRPTIGMPHGWLSTNSIAPAAERLRRSVRRAVAVDDPQPREVLAEGSARETPCDDHGVAEPDEQRDRDDDRRRRRRRSRTAMRCRRC